MNSRLILEKRFNNEILLINPNNKIIKKKKAKDKNPFHINILPFREDIAEKKTGFLTESTMKQPFSQDSSIKSDFEKYHYCFIDYVQKSDIFEDLEIGDNEANPTLSTNSKTPPKNDLNFKEINEFPLDLAIKKVNNLIWKNCFLFPNKHSYNSLITPIKRFLKFNPEKKVLILDWGVSHSREFQSKFYENPKALVISIHSSNQCPRQQVSDSHSWELEALGSKEGKGFNLNLPLRVESDEYFEDSRYLFIFERSIFPVIKDFDPDLVFINNSLDCLYDDEKGNMQLSGNCKC
jgi:hypothetical protein